MRLPQAHRARRLADAQCAPLRLVRVMGVRWKSPAGGRMLASAPTNNFATHSVGADAHIGPNPPQAGLFAASAVEIAGWRKAAKGPLV